MSDINWEALAKTGLNKTKSALEDLNRMVSDTVEGVVGGGWDAYHGAKKRPDIYDGRKVTVAEVMDAAATAFAEFRGDESASMLAPISFMAVRYKNAIGAPTQRDMIELIETEIGRINGFEAPNNHLLDYEMADGITRRHRILVMRQAVISARLH